MGQPTTELKNFHVLVTRLENGKLAEELNEKMAECISEIAEAAFERSGTHKAELTVKLSFQINCKDRVVEVYADVNQKLPKAPRGRGGLYFTNPEGILTREDPHQLTLEDELANKRLKDAERA